MLARKKTYMWHDLGGVNDAQNLKKADIGIAIADSTYATHGASYIILTMP
jgi:magnesium-transporting ATPase (P-type)